MDLHWEVLGPGTVTLVAPLSREVRDRFPTSLGNFSGAGLPRSWATP
jgi:hypothetical protein